MHYLITGGAGFIGSHLSERLLSEGHEILCIDNFNDYYDPKIKEKNLKVSQDYNNFRLIPGDILDEELLDKIFRQNQFDGIIHLAARAGVRPSVLQPKLYEEVNIRGTLNLLEQAKNKNIKKIILASSSSVYGNNKKVPFSESDPVDNPISPYAATKKACELIAYTYSTLYDISISCLRFFTVYGPRQRPDMAIHKFTKLIASGEEIPVFGDGKVKRDFTYYSDIIDGLVRSIDRCNGYNIYNLGESQVIELMDLVSLIEKYLGKKAKINWQPRQPGDVEITYADVTKAKNELDYNPQVNIETGIKQFIKWFEEYQSF
ncbi:GDP-mannose 4,6-dehydratase [candidate division KSB1 bacterium]|nr:GDP-mannose 4,6-dehydratase [candidate division KSB1 bacterium]MBL7092546.1 GDP-mannose 4,6-dehydratase [candidate division KSB1 bacterium]